MWVEFVVVSCPCSEGFSPGVDTICGLSLLLFLVPVPRVFLPELTPYVG